MQLAAQEREQSALQQGLAPRRVGLGEGGGIRLRVAGRGGMPGCGDHECGARCCGGEHHHGPGDPAGPDQRAGQGLLGAGQLESVAEKKEYGRRRGGQDWSEYGRCRQQSVPGGRGRGPPGSAGAGRGSCGPQPQQGGVLGGGFGGDGVGRGQHPGAQLLGGDLRGRLLQGLADVRGAERGVQRVFEVCSVDGFEAARLVHEGPPVVWCGPVPASWRHRPAGGDVAADVLVAGGADVRAGPPADVWWVRR
ncbi:hypothetical protein ABZ918_29425 [Streptomyces viridosporus]|uniref:hypothetical protein n=1 Tax=Streptomyces viridosporus TaxID=67581 RepID=UPI00341C89C5